MPPLIHLDGVTKRFANGTLALGGIDLTVGEGEFVSLLGPSGCGKSTILRLMAGLSAPSAGTIERLSSATIGFVFQEPTLMPWARVIDNVCLPLRLQHVKRPEATARAQAALALVGLEGCARLYPRELSGGMKMRVSIARALVTRPRLLLMDEPFAALDEITRLRLDDELLTLWQAQGVTIVFVTHSVFESVYLSGRVAVMTGRSGRIADTITIDSTPPREGFRLTPSYAAHCAAVSAALDRAAAR